MMLNVFLVSVKSDGLNMFLTVITTVIGSNTFSENELLSVNRCGTLLTIYLPDARAVP